jgi:hypothetical protein
MVNLFKVKKFLRAVFDNDISFVLLLFAINIFFAFYFFKTIPFGDTSSYAHMTKIIVENHSIFQSNFYSYFSILLSIVNIPAYLLFRNEFFSIRLTTLIIHVLLAPIFFILFRKLVKPFDKLLSLLVVFSPWLIYYSAMFSFSEGLTALLGMFAFYFFFRNEKNTISDYLGFSIFSGLAVLARTAYLVFIWPFCVFFAYKIYDDYIRDKEIRGFLKNNPSEIIKKLMALCLVVLPFIIWTIFSSAVIVGEGSHSTNYFSLVTKVTSDYSTEVFSMGKIILSFIDIILLVIPLIFGPVVFFVMIKPLRVKVEKLNVVIFSFCFLVIFHTFWYVGTELPTLIRIRYFIPYFAVGLVALGIKIKRDFKILRNATVSVASYRGFKINVVLLVRSVLIVTIFGFLALSAVVDFPNLSENMVLFYPDKYDTITLQSRNVFSIVDWVNARVPSESKVVVLLKERYNAVGMYYFFSDILRKDLDFYVVGANLTFGSYKKADADSNLSGYYMISHKPIPSDSKFSHNVREIYVNDEEPRYAVYSVR